MQMLTGLLSAQSCLSCTLRRKVLLHSSDLQFQRPVHLFSACAFAKACCLWALSSGCDRKSVELCFPPVRRVRPCRRAASGIGTVCRTEKSKTKADCVFFPATDDQLSLRSLGRVHSYSPYCSVGILALVLKRTARMAKIIIKKVILSGSI